MILLYTLLIVCLSAVAFLLNRRVAALERKYTQAALAVEALAQEPEVKPGNRSRDPCAHAKQQYRLGLLAEKRDRLEDKFTVWSERAEWFGRCLARVKEWKGKKLPYTFGVLDMGAIFYIVDRFGPQSMVNAVAESVRQYLGV